MGDGEFLKNLGESTAEISDPKRVTVKLFDLSNGMGITKDVLQKELESKKIQTLIKHNSWFGCAYEKPKNNMDAIVTQFEKMAYKIVKYWFTGNILYGELEILDTPPGEVFKKFLPYVKIILHGLMNNGKLYLIRFDYVIPKQS